MIRTNEGYTLTSGREIYVNRGIIGLSVDERDVFYGYDGIIWMDDLAEPPWTQAEKLELTAFMVATWQAYAATVRNP